MVTRRRVDRSIGAAATIFFACTGSQTLADPLCIKGYPKTYECCCNDYDPPELRSYCGQLKKQSPPRTTPVRTRVLGSSRFSNDCKIPEEFIDKIDDAYKEAGRKILGSRSCPAAYSLVLKDKASAVMPKLGEAKFALAQNCKPLLKKLVETTGSDEINEDAYSSTDGDTIFLSDSK